MAGIAFLPVAIGIATLQYLRSPKSTVEEMEEETLVRVSIHTGGQLMWTYE